MHPIILVVAQPAYCKPLRLARMHTNTHTHTHTHTWFPCNHDAFHFDWQELLLGIKARYYLSCPVRMGLTGVTFSLVRRGASIHYPVSSELAAGTDYCLPLQRLSVPFYVCHSLTCENESMRSCTREHHLVPCTHADCLVNISLRTCSPACKSTFAMWKTAWPSFKNTPLSWLIPSPSFTPLSPSVHLCSLSSFPLILPYLTCSPPSSTSSFEAPAFREVSLLAGVIRANSSPQWGAH